MRVQFKGERLSFPTFTSNKDTAARKAAEIYLNLLTEGVEATMAKYRARGTEKEPEPAPAEVATVGEYLAAAEKVTTTEKATFGSYCRSLRSIVADVIQVAKSKRRFHHGNSADYRSKIDAISLDVLTSKAIQNWRIRFVERASANPAAKKRARISCNSILRQARSLFSNKKIRKFLSLRLPDPIPFFEVEFYPRASMRYISKMNAGTLLRAAGNELKSSETEVYKILLLGISAGLRRGEIDGLTWEQVDPDKSQIYLETTEDGKLKTEDSTGIVDMDEELCAIMRAFRKTARGKFVVECEGNVPAEAAYGKRYRCQRLFDRAIGWLRAHGVDTEKPLHTLRKEAGSLVADEYGIHAASTFLRHTDIGITAAFYAGKKKRVTVKVGNLLKAEEPSTTAQSHEEEADQTQHEHQNGGSAANSRNRLSKSGIGSIS
jgi:integrase